METIQERFERAPMGILTLEKGEYEGPLILNRPCSVDGRGSLLWTNHGPAVQVAAGPAVLRNFRVAVSPLGPEPLENLAVAVVWGEISLEHVEVVGEVLGVPGEETGWRLPRVVSLGAFAAGTENRFTLSLTLPGAAELDWDLPGIHASPRQLNPGENRVTVTLPPLEKGCSLWTSLWVRTAVARQLLLVGKALQGAEVLHETLCAEGAPLATLRRAVSPLPPNLSPGQVMVRGQRLSLGDLPDVPLTVALAWSNPPPSPAPRPYIFLLQGNGRVRDDGELVGPGNPLHISGAACLSAEGPWPAAAICLNRLPERAERLLVCFAPPEGGNFSTVRDPQARVYCRDREICRFPLDHLHRQKLVAAAELYRYKGAWRLNPVGMGYAGGLPKLCADYGVEVPPRD